VSRELEIQRDLARDVAVQLEQELHAVTIERDAEIARANRAEANIASLRRDLGNLHAWPYGAGERVVKVNELLAVLDAALDSPRPSDAA
jgi:hypothetical protein